MTIEADVAVWTFALSICTRVHDLRPPEAYSWSFWEIGVNTSSRKEAVLIRVSFGSQLTSKMRFLFLSSFYYFRCSVLDPLFWFPLDFVYSSQELRPVDRHRHRAFFATADALFFVSVTCMDFPSTANEIFPMKC
jgi:hypothetical protein